MKTRRKQMFIGAVVLAAASTSAYARWMSHSSNSYHALAVLALAVATSRMKVKLPGLNGNMSVNLPFLLAAVINLRALEAVAIACLSTVVQCWPKRGMKLKTEQMVFNISMMALASSLAGLLFHSAWLKAATSATEPLTIALIAGTLFLGQTVPVAAIIALSDDGSVGRIWMNLARLSFPYYVIGAGMTSMIQTVDHRIGWGAALAIFPVMYGIHRSYMAYFEPAVEALRTTPLARAAGAGA